MIERERKRKTTYDEIAMFMHVHCLWMNAAENLHLHCMHPPKMLKCWLLLQRQNSKSNNTENIVLCKCNQIKGQSIPIFPRLSCCGRSVKTTAISQVIFARYFHHNHFELSKHSFESITRNANYFHRTEFFPLLSIFNLIVGIVRSSASK